MRLFKIAIHKAIFIFFALRFKVNKYLFKNKKRNIGFLTDEFFHKELGGFGGYGKTVKNITDYFNVANNEITADVVLTRKSEITSPRTKRYYNAQVILQPKTVKNYVINYFKYAKIIADRKINLFVTIEYYYMYEQILMDFPAIPCLIWIKDPRDEREWKNIEGVSLEIKTYNKEHAAGFAKMLNSDRNSITRLVNNNVFNRKIVFATQANSLIPIAKRAYGLNHIDPIFLPNPIAVPSVAKPCYSDKPSVLFLGRLEPIKRPWIFFELAKHFPRVDFFVAGRTHFPDLMNPIIQRYQKISNLKFLGITQGKELHDLLNSVWGIVNTSIHEALPVSFLEAFSYFKPVISCQNPDDLTNRFGIYVGEILGEGFDNESINKFADALEKLLSKQFDRENIGFDARQYVEKNHSFSNFEKIITMMLDGV